MDNKQVLEFKGTQIAYYTSGKSNNTAMVFLHPAFGNRDIFIYQVEYFKEDYFTICIDMIGHGDSIQDKPIVNMGNMPEIISNILAQEAVEKAHIAGVSLGSLVAQGFAYYYSQKTLSVTTCGGYSIHKENEKIIKSQQKEIGKWIFRMIFSMKKFREMIVEQSSYSDACKIAMTKSADQFTRKSFLSMGGQDKLFIKNESPVNYPLLLVVGEHDLELALDVNKKLHSIEPNSQLAIIKNAGHCANIDNPNEFNRILKGFIESY